MIDIHSHILWGLDDGPRHLDESIAMAKTAVAEGIHTIIATPHHANGQFFNPADDVEQSVQLFNDALAAQDIPLKVLNGQEIRVYNRLLDDLEQLICQPLCRSRYILLELPASHMPEELDELIFELNLLQLTPIIAHPERNREVASHAELLSQFVENGVLCQVTAGSINGRFGRSVRKAALELCRRGLVHFIASDAHNVTTRGFGLRAAYDVIARYFGTGVVELYQENARCVIDNRDVHRAERLTRKKRWFNQFIKN